MILYSPELDETVYYCSFAIWGERIEGRRGMFFEDGALSYLERFDWIFIGWL